jgi:hypothetical protein
MRIPPRLSLRRYLYLHEEWSAVFMKVKHLPRAEAPLQQTLTGNIWNEASNCRDVIGREFFEHLDGPWGSCMQITDGRELKSYCSIKSRSRR